MIIKILLALCALITAVLSVSDLKTVQEPSAEEPKPWYQRLTKWGLAKIGFAAITFLLLACNEYLAAESSKAAAERATALQANVSEITERSKLQANDLVLAKSALATVVDQLRITSRTLDLFERSMRGTRVRHGEFKVNLEPLSGVDYGFLDTKGGKYYPAKGDKIDFRITCRLGPIPTASGACRGGNFGSFIANSEKFLIWNSSGSFVFPETRNGGGTMIYEAPTGECRNVRRDLQDAYCEFSIEVDRTADQVQLAIMEKEGFPNQGTELDRTRSDLCRAYEILYGERCDTFLTELGMQ